MKIEQRICQNIVRQQKMQILCIASVLFSYGLPGIVRSTPIVGGQLAPVDVDDSEFSFAVSMQLKEVNSTTGAVHYKHFCGGILLQVHDCKAYILSSSHCFFHVNQSNIVVVFGAKNLTTYIGQRFHNLTINSRAYNPYTYENDISVIQVNLDGSCDMKLKPIRLIIDVNSTLSSPCYIYGYGSETLFGEATLDLRIGQVQITPDEMCAAKLGVFNAPKRCDGLFCAHGADPNVDACGGDSGGGLLCTVNNTLGIVGLVTYGLSCGKSGMPGVYTEVAHQIVFIGSVLRTF